MGKKRKPEKEAGKVAHTHPHDHGADHTDHSHEDGFAGVHEHSHDHSVEMTLEDFFHAWFGHGNPPAKNKQHPPTRRDP